MKNLFIIAGAQRSGTTYLYNILDQHPDIYMAKPVQPEPKFFCNYNQYKLGKEYYVSKYFNVAKEYSAYGEKSTSYMTVDGTPKNIHKMFPEVKLLFLLRNPIERAVSNYWYSVDNGLETYSFEYAIKNENKRIKEQPMPGFLNHPFAYLARGRYIVYLNEYLKYFSRDKIVIVKTEYLLSEPIDQIKKIYTFLDVNSNFVPALSGKKVNTNERKCNVLTPEMRNYLIQYYKEDNEQLGRVLNIDFSDWNMG